jgi:glucosamine--fructose-6-phosphate aminotransferase (isomerizing)
MRRLVRATPGLSKLAALEAALAETPAPGAIGIGHTRWATHGAPTVENAHPHRAGAVAVVHNGIIENFRALRDELEAGGVRFETETDTEVVAQLCAQALARGRSPLDAAGGHAGAPRGRLRALLPVRRAEDLLVCARRGSPLAIGFGEGEMFVGSDALALAPLTTRIAYLEEGDYAALTRSGARIFDAADAPVERPVRNVPVATAMVGKDGHRHFMAKEIHEQPAVAAYAVSASLTPDRRRFVSPAETVDWSALDRVSVVACGTAHYAGMIAKYWLEGIARLPADIEIASEFRYRAPPLRPGGAAIFVSQSGETADTLAALRYAQAAGQTTVAVVNVETSTMAREADVVVPIHAGPEIGVASTKAFTAQLIALAALSGVAARRRGALDAAAEARLAENFAHAPSAMAETLELEPTIAALADEIANARSALFLGRGALYPLALEGALKLKELTYMHAEGYAAGELKHGPIALIDETLPVIAFAPKDALFDKTVSNLQEVAARKGRLAMITDAAGAAQAPEGLWRVIEAPAVDSFIAPITYALVAQLIAYHAAVSKGTDVDQPRNLAKSVTVE